MAEYVFDAVKIRDNLIEGLRKLAQEQGFSKVILGISGGKDSTVCAALCARAFGKENVYGVMMPDGVQKDISDSQRVCDALGINRRVVNIGKIHDELRKVTDQLETTAGEGEFEVPVSRASDINVGPRLRMTTVRYIAQAIGARLVGTGNLSEATVGYCTKDGDTSCDFSLLGAVTSIEVVEIGLTMEELPADLVKKAPADGLTGHSDEEQMGLKYQDIHEYIRLGTCGDPEIDEKIRKREKANYHKRVMPVKIDPFNM